MKHVFTDFKRMAMVLGLMGGLSLSAQITPDNPKAKDWSEYFPKAMPSFPSPNAEAFAVFGQIPVTKYTGTPDIRFPLYTLKHGDISVPISLAYHTANRKVNSMPSWVGLSWNMDAGGVITRTIRGKRDENASIQANVPLGGGYPQGFMYNHHFWENNTWQYDENLKGNVIDPRVFVCFPLSVAEGPTLLGLKPFDPIDALPDEYVFNFLGYSGSFHFDPYTEEFVVNSEADIKVIFDPNTDIVLGSEVRNEIEPSSGWTVSICDIYENYIIHFQLLTPDGYIYDFGGIHATEVSAPRQNTHPSQFSTSSWFLTKITSPAGNVVSLNYERGEVICNLNTSYYCILYKNSFEHCGINKCPQGELARRKIEGQVIFPVYLKSIIADQTKIEFQKSNAQSLRYSNEDQNISSNPNSGQLMSKFERGLNGIWKKLNAINIYEGMKLIKKFTFSYNDTPSERLKLLSFREQSPNNAQAKVYSFQYNSNKLPDFCSESTDHWGYANAFFGKPYLGTGEFFHERKEPCSDPSIYLAEILEKITYPTGGYTLLEYEPHDYSKVVNESRSSTITMPGTEIAGGVRIKSIASYDSERSQTHSIKTYNYRLAGHLSHAIPTTKTPSSGILSTTPKYFYYTDNPIENINEPDNVQSIFSSGMIVPFGDAAFGSHVGYSEVTEIESTRTNNNLPATQKNYSRSFYTNFDEDIYGNIHNDWGPGENNNSTHNGQIFISHSKSPERGKLLMERQYRSNGTLASEVQNRYEAIYDCDDIKTDFLTFDYYPACNIRGYYVNVNAKLFLIPFSYLLINTRSTLYGTHANDSLSEYTVNTYNEDLQISQIRNYDSYGNTIETFIKYPRDFKTNVSSNNREISALRLMANHKHMTSTPILVYQTKNNQLVATSFQTFATFDNPRISDNTAILPYRFFELKINQGISSSSFSMPSFSGNIPSIEPRFELQHQCDLYDDYGNLRALSDKLGVTSCLIWGYNKSQPIAMIANANWNTINSSVNVSTLESSRDENTIRNLVNTLRQHSALQQAQIYTYTYKKPWGISSITDPSGITTQYLYDDLGRLTSVKDANLNLLEKIMYNYKLK